MMCNDCQSLLPLYLLGSLDAKEVKNVHEHLRSGCPACIGALAEAEVMLHQLPLTLKPKTPPASAWDKIEAGIRAADDGVPTPIPIHRDLPTPTRNQIKPLSTGAWAGWLGSIAAAAAIVLLAVLLNSVREQNAKQKVELARLQEGILKAESERDDALAQSSEMAQLRIRAADLEQQLKSLTAEQKQSLVLFEQKLKDANQQTSAQLQALASADRYTLTPAQMPKVTGTLFLNKTDKSGVLFAANLAPLPAGKTYELWMITAKGNKIPAGTFDPSAGRAIHTFPIPNATDPYVLAAVTDEPSGGVNTPTGDIQFVTKLTTQ